MRAFIALELPEDFADDAAALARQLSAAVEGRFLPKQTYHVTLAFLGDIDEADTGRAMDALDKACASEGPVPLRADGLGKFGRASDATLWLGLAPDPTLIALADRLREALDVRGISYDAKPFRPHLTLARRARLPKGALPALAFPEPTMANRVTLFKSTLSRDGATYKPLHSAHLG